LEVSRTPFSPDDLQVQLRHVQGTGGLIRLQLERFDTKESIEAEVTREQFRALALEPADVVYVRPKAMRVFAEGGGALDYQI
jgi:sulfate transport system ATP-binding protein